MSVGAKKVGRPVQRSRVVSAHSEDMAGVERMIDALSGQSDANRPVPRAVFTVDLYVGVNRVVTSLGRRAQGCTVTPTVADPTFAWSFAPEGDRLALITVLGVDQPGATVEFF